ncbi:MAG: transposase, partial [Gemmataceae bacterium]
MNRRFAARRDEMLADAEVDPAILRGVLPRLERFLDPFVARMQRHEPSQHARSYVAGLLSNLEYKNVESIAYLHDQQREPLQQFIGQSPWQHDPWLAELTRQVGQQLGRPDGVLVFDPSAFAKKGKASEGRVADVAEVLVVFRERQGDGGWKHDYLLSNASLQTPLEEFARVFKAQHRIEECLQRAKGEAGLADY